MYYSALALLIEEWLEQDSTKYLSIITSRGNKNLSDAFSAFIGFSAGPDLAEETGGA